MRELRMHFTELREFIHRGLINLFLGVEAGAHRPLVKQVKERASFDEADAFGVGQNIEGDFGRNTAIEQFVFGGPRILHSAVVQFLGAGILFQKHGRDVVRFARVGEGE